MFSSDVFVRLNSDFLRDMMRVRVHHPKTWYLERLECNIEAGLMCLSTPEGYNLEGCCDFPWGRSAEPPVRGVLAVPAGEQESGPEAKGSP